MSESETDLDRLLRQARSASEGTTRSINDLGAAIEHARETRPPADEALKRHAAIANTIFERRPHHPELDPDLDAAAGGSPRALHPPLLPLFDVLERLHAVLTDHGIASRRMESLVTDLVKWAADSARQSAARLPDEQAAAALIERIVTGDGAQLENLDFEPEYWRSDDNVVKTGDDLAISVHVEDWIAMIAIANRHRAAAHQAIPAPPPAWQPIGSYDKAKHPLDVLVATDSGVGEARQHDDGAYGTWMWANTDDDGSPGCGRPIYPTHWMALPDRPVSTPDASKEP